METELTTAPGASGAGQYRETEQQQPEGSLRHAARLEATDRSAGDFAHDFNNLLMVITSYAELASSLVDKDSQVTNCLCEIHKAAQRAACLTQQLGSLLGERERHTQQSSPAPEALHPRPPRSDDPERWQRIIA